MRPTRREEEEDEDDEEEEDEAVPISCSIFFCSTLHLAYNQEDNSTHRNRQTIWGAALTEKDLNMLEVCAARRNETGLHFVH